MGKCTSKQQRRDHVIVASTAHQEEIPQPSKAKPTAIREVIVNVKDDTHLICTKSYPITSPFSTIVDSIRNETLPNADYDFLYNKTHFVPGNSKETIETLFNHAKIIDLHLVYAGLDIPKDTLTAYAETTHFIGSPKFETEPFEIISFDKSTSNISSNIISDFPESSKFNFFSAYCNGRDKLFISGGDKQHNQGEYNDALIEIDMVGSNRVKILPNLITGRAWHSMIYIPSKYIFIVGGINTKTVEVFNIETNTIAIDSQLNENRSEATLCLVNNSELYAFCGFLFNHHFFDTIEKCNLRNRKREWSLIHLNKPQHILFEPSFFAVSYFRNNSLILLGCNEMSQIENSKTKHVRNYLFHPDTNSIELYECPPIEDLCSEKFFLPMNVKSSVLIPVHTSENVKVLFMNDGKLEVVKFQEDQQDSSMIDVNTHKIK